jgi:hypothetical protein
MRIAVLFGLCSLCLVGTGGLVSAQIPAAPPEPSIFSQLFPQPTGNNGYEELVLAGQLTRHNEALDALMAGSGTLNDKRNALAQPDIARALALIREGLRKPILSPRAGLPIDEETRYPDMMLMRQLARLLKIKQYVLLADGRTGEAIDCLRDGLRIGYLVQADSLLSGLVGIAVDAILLDATARHLEQMSVGDCDRLLKLVHEWLEAPSPAESVLTAERDMALRLLQKRRSDPTSLRALLKENTAADDPDASAIRTFLADNPSATEGLIDQTMALVQAQYAQLIASLRQPYWERQETRLKDPDSLSSRLYHVITADMGQVTERYARDRVNVQLLGLQTALRRFRWEYERLPASLSELNDDRLTIDPFTGKPFVYRRNGDTYELSSAGPYDRGDQEHPPSGERVPISLPRR